MLIDKEQTTFLGGGGGCWTDVIFCCSNARTEFKMFVMKVTDDGLVWKNDMRKETKEEETLRYPAT